MRNNTSIYFKNPTKEQVFNCVKLFFNPESAEMVINNLNKMSPGHFTSQKSISLALMRYEGDVYVPAVNYNIMVLRYFRCNSFNHFIYMARKISKTYNIPNYC